jgi:hypothetical protein
VVRDPNLSEKERKHVEDLILGLVEEEDDPEAPPELDEEAEMERVEFADYTRESSSSSLQSSSSSSSSSSSPPPPSSSCLSSSPSSSSPPS